MNTNVYLVRHAHSIFTPDEQRRPLSERGKQDAKRVAQILNEEKIDIVISSPYARAIETVEEVAMYNQLPIILVDGFKERKLAAQPVADFEAAMDQLWHNEEFAF
jgi:2,3-bisphosphoglycerate-dependent phosphoglycerate mutase